MNIQSASQTHWDYIVVGTGIGGATCGYSLAKAGKKVLFLEKGLDVESKAAHLNGDYAEMVFPTVMAPDPVQHYDILRQHGRYYEYLTDLTHHHSHTFLPFMGMGTGGSSAIYGAVMERFFPEDFTSGSFFPNRNGSTLPEQWPITYDELKDYYTQAESLYEVHGGKDPLRKNQASGIIGSYNLSKVGQELFEHFKSKQLNPYALPVGSRHVEGCKPCIGFVCPRNCKSTSAKICLKPAIDHYDAKLLTDCEVLRFQTQGNQVSSVQCRQNHQTFSLRAHRYLLAAGALASPVILLGSANQEFPNGLANRSGMVGRNLMRHLMDLYAVFPKDNITYPRDFKELAFNDFYLANGTKYGSFQSFGYLPPTRVMMEELASQVANSSIPFARFGFWLSKPVVKMILEKIFSKVVVFAAILEDLPYAENQVKLIKNDDHYRIGIDYQIRGDDFKRLLAFRSMIANVLQSYHFNISKQSETNHRIAHACGTCRFGNDPQSSVLDKFNRCHDISNLYVVDSSFFPSSGGTNPALTIAANALRVADYLKSV